MIREKIIYGTAETDSHVSEIYIFKDIHRTWQDLIFQRIMEREITKQEFKEYYFRYGQDKDGWTNAYWEQFYEQEQDKKYFFREPGRLQENRMFIISGGGKHRMVFLEESSEESFFEFYK